MVLSDYGNEGNIARLALSARTGRVSHAYLFESEDPEKGQALAGAFAKALLCQEKKGEGCGVCAVCRRIDEGNHPDVIFVRREKTRLLVADVEELQKKLLSRPFEAERKIAVIEEADSMNKDAQNKLLKTLEEPSPGTVIVLLSENREKLLPTIRSRCTAFLFSEERKPLDPKTVAGAGALIESVVGSEEFFEQKKKLSELLKTGKDQKQSDKALELLDAMEEVLARHAEGKEKLSVNLRKKEIFRLIDETEETKKTLLLYKGTAFNIGYLMKDLLIRMAKGEDGEEKRK